MMLAIALVLVLAIAIPLCVRQTFAYRDHLRDRDAAEAQLRRLEPLSNGRRPNQWGKR